MVTSDKATANELGAALETARYRVTVAEGIANLGENVEEVQAGTLVLDLDAFPVDNRFFRDLKKNYPALSIIGISSRSFHPELKEAMKNHIYASLNKPVDPDELIYWLNSIFEQVFHS